MSNRVDSTEIKKEENKVLDYLNIIIRYKKLIFGGTLIVGLIIAVLMFFVIKPIFFSSALIKSSDKSLGLGSLLGSSGLPDLGGLEELSGGGGSTKELALYQEILESRKCIEETIIRFNLMELYDAKYMQDAVKFFREDILSIVINKKAGTIIVGVFDDSPQRAKEIVNFLINQLNTIYVEIRVRNARINREFIEQRYKTAKEDLGKIEDSLKTFQDKFGIAPDIQVQVAARTEIELEAEIRSEEIKLEILKKILSPDQAEVKSAEDKIIALKKQLDEVQNSSFIDNKLNLKGSPEIIMNYLRARRDVEIQNKILTTLIPLYEQSKIEEMRETPTVLIIDEPNIPEKKSKPKRIISILSSMLITFIFLSSTVLVYESFYKPISKKLRENV